VVLILCILSSLVLPSNSQARPTIKKSITVWLAIVCTGFSSISVHIEHRNQGWESRVAVLIMIRYRRSDGKQLFLNCIGK
jgi:hypothetical protein